MVFDIMSENNITVTEDSPDKQKEEQPSQQETKTDEKKNEISFKRYVTAFAAVIEFIKNLWEIFGSKTVTPLCLYNRLLEHIKFEDKEAIMKSINGFLSFFDAHGADIFSNNLSAIPVGARINYGDGKNVYLEIQKFMHKSDPETREAIRQHLMTIASILQPERIVAITPKLGIDDQSNEGKFIDTIMKKANATVSGQDVSNPMSIMASLFSSGVMTDMMSGLQQGAENGQFDMMKMMQMMQNAMTSMMGDMKESETSKPLPQKTRQEKK